MKSKSNPFLRLPSILAAAMICLGSSAFSADYTWNSDLGGSYDGLWTDISADGWNGGPPVANDTALIDNGTVTTTANNQQNGVALTIGASGVLNAANYMYFSPTGSLTLNSGTINVTAADGVGWRAGSLSPTVNANSGSSFINGSGLGLRLEGNTTFTGDGDLTINANLFNTYDGTNFTATSITKSGAGTLTLGGTLGGTTAVYSGGTTVNGGTLALAGFNVIGLGVGPLIINSGSLVTMTGNHSVNIGALTLNGGELSSGGYSDATYGSYYMNGDVAVAAGTSTISAVNITSGGARTFDVAAGGTLNVTGGFSSVYGSFGLTKTGDGTMILAGSNSYTGATNVNAGILSLGDGTNPVNLNDSSAVTIASGAQIDLNFTGIDVVGSLDIDFSGPLPAGTYNSLTPIYGSYFTGSGSLVILAQDGTWTSESDGNWSVSANWAGNIIAVGSDNTATFNATTGVTVTLDTNRIIGNLAFDVSDYIIDGANTLSLNTTTGTPSISVTASRTATISANLGGTIGLEKTGAGTLVLTASNTLSGDTLVTGGVLQLGASPASNPQFGVLENASLLMIESGATVRAMGANAFKGFSGGSMDVTLNGGTLTLNDGLTEGGNHNLGFVTLNGGTISGLGNSTYGGFNLNGPVEVTENSTLSATYTTVNGSTITVSSGKTLDWSGTITNGFNNFVSSLAFEGTGTTVLSGANTYTGNTTINEGTLVLADNAQLKFAVTDAPAANIVTGAGTATFNGDFNIDTSGVSGATGGIWLLVDRDTLTGETFDDTTFTVVDFTDSNNDGIWLMTDAKGDWSFDESTGELTLDVGNDYDDWVTDNGVVGTETDDDDADGLTNFEEYAFGLDPTGGSSVNPIASLLNKTTGAFSYTRRTQSLTGLSYTVWTSTDLGTWNEDTGAVVGTPAVSGEVETVPVTISAALLTNPKLFIQVRAQ